MLYQFFYSFTAKISLLDYNKTSFDYTEFKKTLKLQVIL